MEKSFRMELAGRPLIAETGKNGEAGASSLVRVR